MFNHPNIRFPILVDRFLRLIVVTPDMHRVHYSNIQEETNSNFGFSRPLWHRLLGTYKAQPKAGYEEMSIGIEQFRTTRDLWLDRMLVQQIKRPASGYPINSETRKKS
ncbi:Fatty acid hydroxylase [Sulfitobacter guttiformis KCTC 32187]|nr:Fatty acid hydroxylase [Sulfitobacter guttiformis KCTC 32187]